MTPPAPPPDPDGAHLAGDGDDGAALLPYIELAREIRREVERVVADDTARAEALTEAIERIPREQRGRVAQAVFDRLAPEAQWSILERLFGDEELRAYLESERAARLEELGRADVLTEIATAARSGRRLDTRDLPPDTTMTLGLFREPDVAIAVRRGHIASSCARRLVLRASGDAVFRLIEDTFNPNGGYFVSADYDEAVWRRERLEPHAIVLVGSASEGAGSASGGSAGAAGPTFEPVLYPGGRVDVQTDGGIVKGRLHLGFVMLADQDVFVP